jgi:hypothetical protein
MWQDVVFKTFADTPITIGVNDTGKMFAVDCSGGNVVINLPQISLLDLALPWVVGIKKIDSSGNSLTINRAGTDTIDGLTSRVLTVADSGSVFIPDTDPTPDDWTSADFGASPGNLTVDRFSGNGSTTGFTLSVDPGTENNTLVYVDGVYQQKNTYSLSSTTLTFSTAPPTGTNNIEVISGTILSVGTPADASVTNAKLAVSAISGQTNEASVSPSDEIIINDVSEGGGTLNKATVTNLFAAMPASDTVAGTLEVADQTEMEAGGSVLRAVTPGRQQFHPSAAKGWVVTGASANIQLSYNVTSITDVGTGRIQVNWATAFSDANYCFVGIARSNTSLTATTSMFAQARHDNTTTGIAAMDLIDSNGTAFQDPGAFFHLVAWGDQ